MNSTDPLKDALERAFPVRELSPELAERVARLRARRTPRAPWIAACSAVAAAAGLAAVVVFMGSPRMALADEILQATKNIHGHLLTYTVGPDGHQTLADECWLEADRARSIPRNDPNGLDELLDFSKNIDVLWNPHIHAFVFSDAGNRQQFQVRLAVMTGDIEALRGVPGFDKVPRKTGRGEFRGQEADYVELDFFGGKWTVFADPQSHRTVGVRMFAREPIPGTERVERRPRTNLLGITEEERVVEREVVIGEQVADPAVFLPVFDVDGARIDALAKREAVRARLAHVIATYDSPTGRVAIRDVSMNAHGDVFVLWSGGNGPYGTNVIPVTIQDGTGGKYAKGGGFVAHLVSAGDWPGFVFDGKALEGAWFAHVDGPVASGPITVGFKKEWKPIKDLAFRHTQEPARVAGEVPDYMMFMRVPVDPARIGERRDELAASYFTRTAFDFSRGAAMWRRFIAESEQRPDQRRWDSHFWLGVCLERTGRYDEALKELSLANELEGDDRGGMDPKLAHEIRLTKRLAHMKP